MSVVLVIESNIEDLLTFERLIAEKCHSHVLLASDTDEALGQLVARDDIDMVVCGDIKCNSDYECVTDYIKRELWKPQDDIKRPVIVKAVSDGAYIDEATCLYSKAGLIEHLRSNRKFVNVLCDFLPDKDASRQPSLHPHKPEGWARQILRRILGKSLCAPEGSGF